MNSLTFILLCKFILSRIIFINPLPVFFDSPEYLARLSNPNFFQAIASGHTPFHAGYIAQMWPLFQFSKFMKADPSFTIIFVQIIISAISTYCFYQLLALISTKRTALISTIIASITPLYWITNVSIMMESTYINFFVISLFFITKYSSSKTDFKLYPIYSFFFYGLAFLTHPLVILWLPLMLLIVFIKNKKKMLNSLFVFVAVIIIVSLFNSFLIAKSLDISFAEGLRRYFFDKLNEHVQIGINASSILIIIRNTLIPLLRNSTSIVVIIGLISLVQLFKDSRKLFLLGLFWIFPVIIANQWWDSLFFGRHSAIAIFGLSFLSGIYLERKRKLTIVVFLYMILTVLPALFLLKQPIPYLEEQKIIQTLPKGLLIDSHFARPQIQGNYRGELFFVNEPGYEKDKLENIIDKYLINNKPVFITSQALSDPYGLYSGPYLHALSLSYSKKFELEDIISSYSVTKYSSLNYGANIEFFKIIAKNKSKYPNIPRLNYDRRRLDYFDPISQLWFLIERAKIIQSQNMIKG